MSLESDSASTKAIIKALYEGISRRPGEWSDWQRLRPLVIDGAQIIPPATENKPPGLRCLFDISSWLAENHSHLPTLVR